VIRRLRDALLLLSAVANAHHLAVLVVRFLQARRRAAYQRH
jgi:hypothetical protein